jgi:hypothetical protein
MSSLWFFETWSPHDGVAFASQRRGAETEREAVVALLPPWRPVQVALPTALRAERGPFQVGFFDDQGTAIGFDNLQDLVNVVRQAYVAAGSGRPPPEGEQALLPDLPPLPSLGEVPAWADARQELLTKERSPKGAAAFSDALVNRLSVQLGDLFRTYARRIVILMSANGRTSADDTLVWRDIFGRMGLGDRVSGNPAKLPGSDWNEAFWWTGVDLRGEFTRGLLFRTPHPTDPTTLGDALVYKLTDRGRLQAIDLQSFAALLFAAAALTVATTVRPLGLAPEAWLQEVQREAATWIFWNVPLVPPDSPAGKALASWSPA